MWCVFFVEKISWEWKVDFILANFTYKRTLTDKVTIKGMLSEDGKIVTVTEKDGEKEVTVQDYIDKFKGDYIEITLQTKSENDLTDEEVE